MWRNREGKEFIIASRNNERSTQKHVYYNIEFLETGYTDCVRSDTIKSGYVADKLSRSCCGVGIIGFINTRDHFHEYKIWSDMIRRCYDKKDKSYRFYGMRGVTVCDRWHRFDFFFEDIPNIQGFNREKFENHELRLDKDILSVENKVYSPDTTMWISDLDNQKVRTMEYNMKNKKYAVFPDGHVEIVEHVTDFCKQNNLNRSGVYGCLSGQIKQTKGFKFYRE